ncbi:hypothetical protein ACF0H5_002354 [Mactra antiquata]
MMISERIFSVFDVLTFSILGIVDTVIFGTVLFDILVCVIEVKVVLCKVLVVIPAISFWLCVFLVVVRKKYWRKHKIYARDINQNVPLLVICFNSSRLGTDAKNAINNITDPRSAVLLVFYHNESHALPSQHSDKKIVGDKFSSLHGIVDIACVTGKGVYRHDMNSQSISKVKQYIDAYQPKNIP